MTPDEALNADSTDSRRTAVEGHTGLGRHSNASWIFSADHNWRLQEQPLDNLDIVPTQVSTL